MRVLVATLPFLGHVLPTETVVRALVRRGHGVTWLTGAFAEKLVTRAGATFRPLTGIPEAEPAPIGEWFARLRDGMPSQRADCADVGCDRVLADPTMLGVHAWARGTDTPLHLLGILPVLGPVHAVRLWQATIPECEPWRLWHGQPITFVGPLAVRTTWTPPAWWATMDKNKPRVVVTQGTLATHPSRLLIPARDAMAGLAVTPVFTAPTFLAPTAAPWMPLPTLLEGAALLVTSGGYGGIQAALMAGVPVLVAGETEDKAENGKRVDYAGTGLALAPPYTSARLRDAILTMLQTPRFYERARELQGRIPVHPAADTIADGVTVEQVPTALGRAA